MADLWDRLRAVQARTEQPTTPAIGPPAEETAPDGWTWVTPLVAESRFELPLEPRFWQALGPRINPAEWDQVLCFDTETTGLSGGAGTVAFLIGWARLVAPAEEGGVPSAEVRQWFLRDHPGEPDLIHAVDQALEDARGLVSFNGASFDLPLLRSRWSLAGRTFPPRAHRDDLHPSRRLWKRLLDSCRLGRIEQTVLGIRRRDDVPGALVPALWFDYLRQGASADFLTPLEGVLRHHAQDVYSLLCLDLLLTAIRKDPGSPRWLEAFAPPAERTGIARPGPRGLLHPDLPRQVPVDFWGLLPFQDEAGTDVRLEAAWNAQGGEALGMAWADRLKRRRDPRAVGVWLKLWEEDTSYPALEELLKWWEHRDRSTEAKSLALDNIDRALKAPFLPRAWREALEKRRNRLARSLSSTPP